VNQQKNHILIWKNGNINPSTVLYSDLSSPRSIFVTSNGNIYIGDQNSVKQVSYSNSSRLIMQVSSYCMGLFIDTTNNIYCSIDYEHRVFKKWLGDNISVMTTVAGNGSPGSTSNQLRSPNGIFVDTNFDLYIADWGNSRIQLFRLGQSNGITVAGETSPNSTIILKSPSNVILDGNKYVFITDDNNNRIIGSDEYGFRCVAGCTGSKGSNSNQLSTPRSIAFDSVGNLYVIEFGNSRIQKFTLSSNPSYRKFHAGFTISPIYIFCLDCYAPKIILIPSDTTLSNPRKHRRSEDFYIESIIEIKCNDSISLKKQWIIKNCTSTCLHSIILDSTVETSFSELHIPARTLPFGIYEFQLTVTLNKNPSLKTTSSIYIEIIPSNLITANLVQFGISMITIGYEQNLKLDPGTYSINPDKNTFDSSVSFDCSLKTIIFFLALELDL